MNINVHPLFVHFPIALLTLYALIEIIPLAKIRANEHVRSIKLFLLFVGEVGAAAAGLTGSLAGHTAWENPDIRYPQIIHTHSFFAELTFTVFGLISIIYLAQIICMYVKNTNYLRPLALLSNYYLLMAILAVIGAVLLIITGALGGIIVYGPNLDPFTHFIYTVIIH